MAREGGSGGSVADDKAGAIQQVQSKKPRPQEDTEQLPRAIQLQPPSAELLFRMESEKSFRERLRQEERSDPWAAYMHFPEDKPQPEAQRGPRLGQPSVFLVEPSYVCSKRLFFEQPRSERFGESVGVLQPFIGGGLFYFDVAALPFRLVGYPWDRFECHRDCYSPYFSIPQRPCLPSFCTPWMEERNRE